METPVYRASAVVRALGEYEWYRPMLPRPGRLLHSHAKAASHEGVVRWPGRAVRHETNAGPRLRERNLQSTAGSSPDDAPSSSGPVHSCVPNGGVAAR